MTADTDRRRWLALYVLCTGVLMIVLDATVVNVALPSIKNDLNFTQPGSGRLVGYVDDRELLVGEFAGQGKSGLRIVVEEADRSHAL